MHCGIYFCLLFHPQPPIDTSSGAAVAQLFLWPSGMTLTASVMLLFADIASEAWRQ